MEKSKTEHGKMNHWMNQRMNQGDRCSLVKISKTSPMILGDFSSNL